MFVDAPISGGGDGPVTKMAGGFGDGPPDGDIFPVRLGLFELEEAGGGISGGKLMQGLALAGNSERAAAWVGLGDFGGGGGRVATEEGIAGGGGNFGGGAEGEQAGGKGVAGGENAGFGDGAGGVAGEDVELALPVAEEIFVGAILFGGNDTEGELDAAFGVQDAAGEEEGANLEGACEGFQIAANGDAFVGGNGVIEAAGQEGDITLSNPGEGRIGLEIGGGCGDGVGLLEVARVGIGGGGEHEVLGVGRVDCDGPGGDGEGIVVAIEDGVHLGEVALEGRLVGIEAGDLFVLEEGGTIILNPAVEPVQTGAGNAATGPLG